MMTEKLPIRKRLRRAILYTVVIVVVTAAVLLSLARVLISDVKAYHFDIEQIASAFLDHPVKIESMDARFVGMTPTLVFNHVRLLDKTGKFELVSFKQAELGIAVLSSLRAEKLVPDKMVIEGINLAVTRQENGNIQIQGVDITTLGETTSTLQVGQPNELANWLFRRSRLALRRTSVVWKDMQRGGVARHFTDVNLQLLNDEDNHTLSGRISLPPSLGTQFEFGLDIHGDVQKPANWVGEFYLRGDAINLGEWQKQIPEQKGFAVRSGILDIKLWGELQQGRLTRLSGDTTAYKVLVNAPFIRGTLDFRMLGGLFDYRASEQDHKLAVERLQVIRGDNVWPVSQLSLQHRIGTDSQPDEVELLTDQFRLQDVSQLLTKTKLLPKSIDKRLMDMQPAGTIRQLHLRTMVQNEKFSAPYFLQSKFEQLAIKPSGKLPGLTGVSGSVWTNAELGRLSMKSDAAMVEVPRLFRAPLKLEMLSGELNWQKQRHGWQFWADNIIAANQDLKTLSSMQLDVPFAGDSPYLDLQVAFGEGNASQASPYYPVHIMKKPLVKWLDQSIVGGRVTHGGAVLNGRLHDFPFKQHQGQFLVEFSGEDLELAYYPGWPLLSKAEAEIMCSAQGIAINVTSARLLNSQVTHADITIPRFTEAELNISGKLKGSIYDMARFLVESPLASNAGKFVTQHRIEGQAMTRLQLHMPLSAKMRQQAPMGLQGEVTISNGALYLLDEKLDITGLNGVVQFTETEESARDIQGFILGEPAQFNIVTQSVNTDLVTEITATSHLDAGKLVESFGGVSGDRLIGMSDWQGVLRLPHGKNGNKKTPHITLSSSLQGVTLDLPNPIRKQPGEARDLMIEIQFAEPHIGLVAKYADQFCSSVLLGENKLQAANLHFGSGCKLQPEHSVLKLSGVVDEFSVGEWRDAMNDLLPATGSTRSVLPIVLAMDRMGLKKLTHTEESTQKLTPAEAPLINGEVKQLIYDGMDFGQASITTSRLRKGIRVENFNSEAPYLKLNATGQWTQWLGRDWTKFDVQFSSPDAGKMIEALGFAAVIEKGELQANATVAWPDRLDRFDAAKAEGKIHLNIKKGNFTEVEAGAGRLLGLFSLSALPRRLALDFRDTFKSGFQFDEIDGDITFHEGNAYTENLTTTSPVAQIKVEGRTGYLQQDFDQKVIVTPKVSGTLPVAGGLIFGLEIGAAIILLDKLLGEEINKASSREYHVTGSWNEPVITEIGRQVVEQGVQDSDL
jgi:uncharacterized protein (TIGR02099 family)